MNQESADTNHSQYIGVSNDKQCEMNEHLVDGWPAPAGSWHTSTLPGNSFDDPATTAQDAGSNPATHAYPDADQSLQNDLGSSQVLSGYPYEGQPNYMQLPMPFFTSGDPATLTAVSRGQEERSAGVPHKYFEEILFAAGRDATVSTTANRYDYGGYQSSTSASRDKLVGTPPSETSDAILTATASSHEEDGARGDQLTIGGLKREEVEEFKQGLFVGSRLKYGKNGFDAGLNSKYANPAMLEEVRRLGRLGEDGRQAARFSLRKRLNSTAKRDRARQSRRKPLVTCERDVEE